MKQIITTNYLKKEMNENQNESGIYNEQLIVLRTDHNKHGANWRSI